MSLWRTSLRLAAFRAAARPSFPRQYNAPRPAWKPWPRKAPSSFVGRSAFHASRPTSVPIIPLPAVLGALKTGKFLSFISFSSKTTLTLLPHTFRRHRARTAIALLASTPIIGFIILVLVGLDVAPNTSRLRVIYLTEEEEQEVVDMAINEILDDKRGLIVDSDNIYVKWLREIIDNLSAVAVDDIRDPVRRYDQPGKEMSLYVVNDSSTLNAMCAGNHVLVFNLMMYLMDCDTDKMAAILAHEMAHSIQRHSVESHAIASLLVMLGDITRGFFWVLTESLGPYVNEKINEILAGYVLLETETTYNRPLEREADLVGLKLMAKAGYDPRAAVEVWKTMAEFNEKMASYVAEKESNEPKPFSLDDINAAIKSWFGSTHPEDAERIEYLSEHMDEAVAIYEETIRINGARKPFDFTVAEEEEDDDATVVATDDKSNGFFSWIISWFPAVKTTQTV